MYIMKVKFQVRPVLAHFLKSDREKIKFSLNSSTKHTRDKILDKFYVYYESEISGKAGTSAFFEIWPRKNQILP